MKGAVIYFTGWALLDMFLYECFEIGVLGVWSYPHKDPPVSFLFDLKLMVNSQLPQRPIVQFLFGFVNFATNRRTSQAIRAFWKEVSKFS